MRLDRVGALAAVVAALTTASARADDGGVDTASGVYASFSVGSIDRAPAREIAVGGAASVRQRVGRVVATATAHLLTGGFRHLALGAQIDLVSGKPTFQKIKPRLFVAGGVGVLRAGGAVGGSNAGEKAPLSAGRDRRAVYGALGLEWGWGMTLVVIADPERRHGPTVLFQTGTALFW